jgi:hypothetical protein
LNNPISSSCLCLEEEVKVLFVLSEEADLIQPDPNTELMLAFSGEFKNFTTPCKITLVVHTRKISKSLQNEIHLTGNGTCDMKSMYTNAAVTLYTCKPPVESIHPSITNEYGPDRPPME